MAFGPSLIESYTFIPAILLIRIAILPIQVHVMSRPLLHLFGKLVYNGWAISLGGATSNIAYEKGFPCHHCILAHSYLSEIWSALVFIRGRVGTVQCRIEKTKV